MPGYLRAALTVGLSIFVGAGFSETASAAAPGADVFGSLPAMSRPHISPDGKYLSAIEPVDGHPAILVFQLDAAPGTAPMSLASPDWFPVDTKWVSNDRFIGIMATEKMHGENTGMKLRTYARAVSISISGKPAVVLMKNRRLIAINNGTARIVGLDPKDPDHVLMEAWDWNREMPSDTRMSTVGANLNLYSVSMETGDAQVAEDGTDKTIDWVVDGQGRAVARLDQDMDLQTTVYLRNGDNWHKGFTYDASQGASAGVVGVTADGRALAVERYGDADTLAIDSFPLSGTAFGPALFSDSTYDIAETEADDWGNFLVGVGYYDDKAEFSYFDPLLESVQKALVKALPGESVRLVGWDRTRDHFVVATGAPKEPTIYNLFTRKTGQLTPLASEYPTLRAADLGDMKPYNYKASDGLAIHAYLTLPPGKTAKNLPTVILPHGGPEDRDYLRFDWLAQFLATRGYAVLQPNFRGSSGYGWNFVKASFGEWGKGKMQGDISDGVRKLIADGIADPKRICIVGASYGGYAALAGATFSADLYACAVSYAGIGDVASLIGNATEHAGKNSEAVAYWQSRLGGKRADAAFLASISPAKHAQDVKAPILLIHCNHDFTVPIGQSILEQSALEKAGKSVKFVQIDGDDHYLEQASTRQKLLREVEAFLAAHIGDGATTAAR